MTTLSEALKDRPTVYVAGPYSSDPVMGTRKAIHVADAIWEAGGAPYVPHLTHLWHLISPHPYEDWLELDLVWVSRCDMLVRLPGKSSGADREVAHAEQECIPVFNLDACLTFLHQHAAAARVKYEKPCRKICEWCEEGWPVHYANKSLGWVHTQPGELSATDCGAQFWERCHASSLRDQYRKQGQK